MPVERTGKKGLEGGSRLECSPRLETKGTSERPELGSPALLSCPKSSTCCIVQDAYLAGFFKCFLIPKVISVLLPVSYINF